VADDYAGLKAAISAFLTAVPLDKGIVHTRERDAEMLRQLTALFRAKCSDQGITV
jgi:hypothetical protein